MSNRLDQKGMTMRILIADDHGVIRQGLKALVDQQADMEVVGEAEDGRKVAELASRLSPDLILMDISMPNMGGADATRLILRDNPDIKIIALSAHFNKHFVTDMLRAGASGYVLKSCLFDEVLRAIQTVGAGDYYLSPKIADIVVEDYKYYVTTPNESSEVRLTARERQVIQLLAEGKSIKQIAQCLHVSPKTVDSNRREVMNKLGIFSIPELTKYAIREGLTSVEF